MAKADQDGLSRRELVRLGVLTGVVAGSGLTLSCKRRGAGIARVAAAGDGAGGQRLASYVQINDQGAVRLIMPWTEAGQGISTGLATLLGEELDVEPKDITFQSAGHGDLIAEADKDSHETGGGAGIGESWGFVRDMAIAARMMLVSAAAAQWGVDAKEITVSKGKVVHRDKSLPYGALATAASALPVPGAEAIDTERKKNEADRATAKKSFTYIGKDVARVDILDKILGKANFGVDTVVEGMLAATMVHSPFVGGQASRVDDAAAKAIPGFRAVVQTPYGVGVVADTFPVACAAARKLKITWSNPTPALSSALIAQQQKALVETTGTVAEKVGAGAGGPLVFHYEFPYLPHATLEPQNCTAWVKPNGDVEVWAPTQSPGKARELAARIAGVEAKQVKVHVTLVGGAFGRRLRQDYVGEAVHIAKAMKVPVKMIWTREQDFIRDYYRPASQHKVELAVDGSGKVAAWQHRIACSSITAWDNDEPPKIPGALDGVDEWAVEGAIKQPYLRPSLNVEWHQHESGVPVTWLRGVGHGHTGFVVETILDELAARANVDALTYRLSMLEDSADYTKALDAQVAFHAARANAAPAKEGEKKEEFDSKAFKDGLLAKRDAYVATLKLAAEKGGWRGGANGNRFQGLAVHESLGSTVAHMVEIEMDARGLRVKKVVCAVASGFIVNPDIVRQSMEGSIIQGLTAALKQEITIDKGAFVKTTFLACPLLSMAESPEIEVHFVPGGDEPRSIDSGVPAVAPALCNAIFRANGRRVRRLPLLPADLVKA